MTLTTSHILRVRGNEETIRTGSSFPTDPTPAAGDWFYHTTNLKVYIYDGTVWRSIAALQTATSTSTSSTSTSTTSTSTTTTSTSTTTTSTSSTTTSTSTTSTSTSTTT
jgi:hypothetical protein